VPERVDEVGLVEQRRVRLQRQLARFGEHRPPAALGVVGVGAQRRHQQPERRDQPEQRDQDQHRLHRAAADPPDDAGAQAAAGRPGRGAAPGAAAPAGPVSSLRGPGDLLRGAHVRSCRILRMLNSMAGTTRRNSSTAMALPAPWSLPPPNALVHISSASTLAFGSPPPMMYTRSNTFSTLMVRVTSTTMRTGASSGIVTRRNTCHSVAPSTRAASSASRGIAASPAAISTIANPAHTHRYDTMIAGVISVSPSHSAPR